MHSGAIALKTWRKTPFHNIRQLHLTTKTPAFLEAVDANPFGWLKLSASTCARRYTNAAYCGNITKL